MFNFYEKLIAKLFERGKKFAYICDAGGGNETEFDYMLLNLMIATVEHGKSFV